MGTYMSEIVKTLKKNLFSLMTGKGTFATYLFVIKNNFALTLIYIIWVPGDPRSIFLVTSFIRKMPESSDSMYSSIYTPENI